MNTTKNKQIVIKSIPSTNHKYGATSEGKIMNLKTGRVMKPSMQNAGYHFLSVSVNKVRKQCLVHRLVAEAFHGECKGLEVNHKDGNKLNNTPENLEYCSRKQNMQHSAAQGLSLKKITPEIRNLIIAFLSVGYSIRKVVENVNHHCGTDIGRGTVWHVKKNFCSGK